MKNLIILLMMTGLMFTQVDMASAQIKNPLKKRVEKNVDKGLDKLEDGIGNLLKKDKGEESDKEGKQADQEQAQEQVQATDAKQTGAAAGSGKEAPVVELKWSKYDFVPGDKIIFEDNQIGEENGEFPSRWDLVAGTVENAQYGGENVIMFRGGSPTIIPYLKNSDIDYLPDVFTVEFDLLMPGESFTLFFSDRKNQRTPSGSNYLSIWSYKMDLSPASSTLPDKGSIANRWAHIAIAYTEGKMKAYIDETRLINIPHLSFDPTGISLHAYHASDTRRFLIKNFRIAEGGVKYYDRFLQDGKIVSNGIRFNSGKSTLLPESMGVLNEIYKMLDEHPEVNVSIEGHTDNVGDNDMNQKLSEERADAVRKQLISMGIKDERLTSKGFGESKPVNTNETPEGRAENRRVEFVKNTGSASSGTSSNISANTPANTPVNTNKDTKTYKAIKIGSQEWMSENLDVSTFRNGDVIPQAKTVDEWEEAKWEKKPAWCYYDSDPANEKKNGKLYNWFAVNDPRKLAPEGWKIPANEDWDRLRTYLGISSGGKKIKSAEGWKNNENGTGETGFNGIPAGFRDYDGSFTMIGAESYWWSSTNSDPSDDDSPWASCRYLSYEDSYLHKHNMSKGAGLSVRCIKE
jgi:OOP family OmpA-OmpF porin